MTREDILFWVTLASSVATFIALAFAAYEMKQNRDERKNTREEHRELRSKLDNVGVYLFQFLDNFDRIGEMNKAIEEGRKEGKDVTALEDSVHKLKDEERKLVTATISAIYNVGLVQRAKVGATVKIRKDGKEMNLKEGESDG